MIEEVFGPQDIPKTPNLSSYLEDWEVNICCRLFSLTRQTHTKHVSKKQHTLELLQVQRIFIYTHNISQQKAKIFKGGLTTKRGVCPPGDIFLGHFNENFLFFFFNGF